MKLGTILRFRLQERYPNAGFIYPESSNEIATLAFPHGLIGPITVVDDEDEVTIYIDHATHGHFGCYDEALSESERTEYIVDSITKWLDALLQDRLVIFTIFNGFSGGWKIYTPPKRPAKYSLFWQRYVWTKKL